MLFKIRRSLFSIALVLIASAAVAQPKWTIDPFGSDKKPKEYEEKKLPSEKTGDKKFTRFKRFVTNNTTRYNYYFNATNKLNYILEQAKGQHRDEYNQLLDFYPYSLEQTAVQKNELDSVILKATSGILLHDLRSDWVDNLYLLIGKAYYFRNQLDSAMLTFQFINYNLYPRPKDDDYSQRVIGTREDEDKEKGSISIADKEKLSFMQKVTGIPPSRNDALVWLVRTFTEQKEFGDAAGMINILRSDKNLPKRLQDDFHQVVAYWYYTQANYDSSAVHLEKALGTAATKQDLGRWEYLLAQMYERSHRYDKAGEYFAKASKHTVDPELEIYAKLNNAKMLKNGGNPEELNKTIANLLAMAKKDRYEDYRDIIYYSTAELSMQHPDTTGAINFYTQSIKNNTARISYKNRSFLSLANIAYNQRWYEDASNYYDSINIDKSVIADSATIAERREILGRLVKNIKAVKVEDSLQHIASLSESERKDLVRKLVRQYRKAHGLQDEQGYDGGASMTFTNSQAPPPDLFSSASRGEWYFYNENSKSRGFTDFKNRWGKRSDIDNWRTKSGLQDASNSPGGGPDTRVALTRAAADSASAYSFDGMMANLPLSKEKLDTSNIIIAQNLLKEAVIFRDELNDYPQAIAVYEDYLRRFENTEDASEAYFGLYYCYQKLGDHAKANYYKNLVTTKFPASKYSNIITNPSLLKKPEKDPVATAKYQDIYNMFISGKFDDAVAAKKIADSAYGNNYWTPQLLYIESVYYIREKQDSIAIEVLNSLKEKAPNTPMAAKAETMIDVLKRRAEIEKYLTELQVTREQEDTMIVMEGKKVTEVAVNNAPVTQQPSKPFVVAAPKPAIVLPAQNDNSKFVSGQFVLEPDKQHYVAMFFDNVDFVYVREAKTALERYNKNYFADSKIVVTRDALGPGQNVLLFAPFTDMVSALSFLDKIKKGAPSEMPWLQANKYYFLPITDKNLQVLKENKNIQQYKDLLNNNLGKRF